MLLNFSYQRTPVNVVYPSQAGSPDDDTKEMYRSLIKPSCQPSPLPYHLPSSHVPIESLTMSWMDMPFMAS